MTDYYNGAMSGSLREEGVYDFKHQEGAWLRMEPQKGAPFSESEGGIRFHLSVDARDVKDAWNIVIEEMMKEKGVLSATTAVMPSTASVFAKPGDRDAGKMITIITNAVNKDAEASAERYLRLLQRIEDRFNEAGIRRGPHVKRAHEVRNGDRDVPGSKFASYGGKTYDESYNQHTGVENDPGGSTHMGSPGNTNAYEKLLKAAPIEPLREVANWNWEKAEGLKGFIMHIEVENKATAQKTIRSLARLGITAQERTIENPRRLTVRIEGKDMKRIEAEQERQKHQTPGMKVAESSLYDVMSRKGWELVKKNGKHSVQFRVADEAAGIRLRGELRRLGVTAIMDESGTTGGLRVRIAGESMGDALKAWGEAEQARKARPSPSKSPPPRPRPGS